MRRITDSLVFKIGLAVILVEAVALAAIGVYYVTRFSRQVEEDIRARISIPGELMGAQQMAFSMVSDQETLDALIGETVEQALFVDINLKVFYALDDAYLDRHVSEVPGVVTGEFDPDDRDGSLRETPDGWIYIMPVGAMAEAGPVVGYSYIKVGTEQLDAQRRAIIVVFAAGSLVCLALTSATIIWILNALVLSRIGTLSGVVQRVQAGDLAARAPGVAADDELGVLQAGVNEMVARLQEMVVSLEERVEDRTSDLERRASYLEATAEVARDVASEFDLQDLLNRVVELISERFDFYHAGIFLLDEAGEWAVLQAASSRGGRRMLDRGHRLGVGQTGTVGYVTQHGESRIALDVGEDAAFFNNPDLPETRSAMTLPLRARGEIIGALDVQSTEPAAFSDEDAAVLQILADQVATAIDNVRLFQEAQAAAAEAQRAYGEITRSAWLEMLQRQQAGLGYYCDADGVEEVADPKAVVSADAGHQVLLPVTIRDQVIGVVRAHKSDAEGTWTEDEHSLLETLVEQLNVALEGARLYQESLINATQQRLVGEITAEMRRSLELETVLETAAREMQQVLGLTEAEVRLGVGWESASVNEGVKEA